MKITGWAYLDEGAHTYRHAISAASANLLSNVCLIKSKLVQRRAVVYTGTIKDLSFDPLTLMVMLDEENKMAYGGVIEVASNGEFFARVYTD